MKYSAFFLAVLIILNFGCAAKQVDMSPTDKQQLQAIQQGKYEPQTDKKLREGEILEEELARREQERMKYASLRNQELALLLKDILFDFDSYTVKSDYFSQLNKISSWLKQNSDKKIVVEGHCDEKGTVEYNLALGQKRAESVKMYLTNSGVEASRIKTISYGKELPIDPGHSEDSWAKNRRASIKID